MIALGEGSPVSGAAGTDPADFDAAFRALYPRARALAYRMLGDPARAEDAAAEALARALASWKRVGNLPYREPWVLRVTANVAVDMCRRDRHLATTPLVVDAAPIGATEEADHAALRLALSEALAALPRRQREVIVLQHLVGLPQAEVAACLGVTIGSVKRHGHRALASLRTRLGEGWTGRAQLGGGVVDVA